ncbi:hypothetical protein HK098_003200 [Nowakowskiella sp. JEL0407]|nr:hypothetical protein HK098_003200 [Nowakowskiella sp. JEL0407]
MNQNSIHNTVFSHTSPSKSIARKPSVIAGEPLYFEKQDLQFMHRNDSGIETISVMAKNEFDDILDRSRESTLGKVTRKSIVYICGDGEDVKSASESTIDGAASTNVLTNISDSTSLIEFSPSEQMTKLNQELDNLRISNRPSPALSDSIERTFNKTKFKKVAKISSSILKKINHTLSSSAPNSPSALSSSSSQTLYHPNNVTVVDKTLTHLPIVERNNSRSLRPKGPRENPFRMKGNENVVECVSKLDLHCASISAKSEDPKMTNFPIDETPSDRIDAESINAEDSPKISETDKIQINHEAGFVCFLKYL